MTLGHEESVVGPQSFGIGCEQLGGTDWGHVDVEEIRRGIGQAWDLGVRTFDTADAYGLGVSESRLADVLGHRRHEASIITKGGIAWRDSGDARASTWKDCRPSHLRNAITESLRRLRLAALPIYLVHWPDGRTPLDAVLEHLELERSQGRILRYGLSNFGFADSARATRLSRADVFEEPLNLLSPPRQIFEAREFRRVPGRSVVAYGALAQGLLSGSPSRSEAYPPTDRRHRLSHFRPNQRLHVQAMIERLSALASRTGFSRAQLSLLWLLESSAADVVLLGVRRQRHVDALDGLLQSSDPIPRGELHFLRPLSGATA